MRLRINNHFHNTSTTVLIKGDSIELNSGQVKRVEAVLCGMPDCVCGGMWSEKHTEIEGYEAHHFEPEIHYNTGKTVGAFLVKDYYL